MKTTPHRIHLRYQPRHAGNLEWVELRGEMSAWADPLPLERRGDAFEAELALSPGVYAYKLRHADLSWHLDPSNPRTSAAGGQRNSLLVVGGTAEPTLHAPVPPWLFRPETGGLRVRAGLRRDAGDTLSLRWDEGHGWREWSMERVAADDEHRYFEAQLPASARTLSYLFRLASGALIGRADGPAFDVRPAVLAAPLPEWWRDAVLYTIFVDRFRPKGGTWDPPPPGEQERFGGCLEGAREGLAHLAALGVNTLHLTPVFASDSAHRYDVRDFGAIDPALGGEEALRRFVEAAHAREMRVLLDLPITHVSRMLPQFLDVRDRGLRSPYAPWFYIHAHPFTEGLDPGYRYYQKGAWREPLLRLEEPGAQAFILEAAQRAMQTGVDGLRIDAAAEAPKELLRAIVKVARDARRDAVVFGEITPDHVASWTDGVLHAGTDFLQQKALLDFLERGAAANATQRLLSRQRLRRTTGATRIAFSATHDQVRLRSRATAKRTRLAHLWVLMRPEVPMLLYGDEVGLRSDAPERTFEDVWPDRMPMPWSQEIEDPRWDRETLGLVREALALRRESRALRRGEERPLRLDHPDLLGFRRLAGDEVLDVMIHRGEGEVMHALPEGPPHARVLLRSGDAGVGEEGVRFAGESGLVLRRELTAETRRWVDALIDETPRLGKEAFVEGLEECPALPRRLYLTLTERCNLRCIHCITDAPRHTTQGSARSMQPWVIDALRECFGAARYVGFSHGGESLVHPGFFDVLKAIQQARHGRPGRTDIHLLSNGRLLRPELLARLVDGGLTSLAISVDGASARTQQAIRLGSRWDELIRHLESAVALRDAGADLRVGISAVLTTRLCPELPALGRLALRLGVDWLKVEETVAVNQAARELNLDPRGVEARKSMAGLRDVLRQGPVRLVDHLQRNQGCGCDGDAAARTFREADDFANRARFRPCSMPWEQIAVDPDGAVRPVDYEHPIAGQLRAEALPRIWNGELFRSLRRAHVRRYDRTWRARCGES